MTMNKLCMGGRMRGSICICLAVVSLSSSGCVEFLDAVAAGAGGFGQGMSGHRSTVARTCFSSDECGANQVCAIARYTGYGVCVDPTELARQ